MNVSPRALPHIPVFFTIMFFIHTVNESQNPLDSKNILYAPYDFKTKFVWNSVYEFVLEFFLTNPSFGFAGEGCIAFWKIKL